MTKWLAKMKHDLRGMIDPKGGPASFVVYCLVMALVRRYRGGRGMDKRLMTIVSVVLRTGNDTMGRLWLCNPSLADGAHDLVTRFYRQHRHKRLDCRDGCCI